MHVCNAQCLFFKNSSLLKSQPIIQMLASLQFSHWPLAMGIYSDMLQSGEKMCSHDTRVDCSCLMNVTSSSQCSLTNVSAAANSVALLFSLLGWCLYAPPSDSAADKICVRQ